jgi:hypothetical protein
LGEEGEMVVEDYMDFGGKWGMIKGWEEAMMG